MPGIRQEIVTLTGKLYSWRVMGADGWGVGTLLPSGVQVDDFPELSTTAITGKLVGVRVGDAIELEGTWGMHDRYGKQFKVRKCTLAASDTLDGVVAWMASTLPDIGEGRAKALVNKFGATLWHVIEGEHDKLSQVEGITPARALRIHTEYLRHKSTRDDMIKLRGWGLTDKQIARCVERWGSVAHTVEHVRENPYELSAEVHGFGFDRADKVASKAGVPHDSPHRIAAGIEFTLEEAIQAGHCFLWGGALKKLSADKLGVEPKLVEAGIM